MVQLHLSLDAEPRKPLQILGSGPPEHPERQERGVPRNGPAERREAGEDTVLPEDRLPFEDAQGRPRHEGGRERRPARPSRASASRAGTERRSGPPARGGPASGCPRRTPTRGPRAGLSSATSHPPTAIACGERAGEMTSFAGSQPAAATTTRRLAASRATSAGTSLFCPATARDRRRTGRGRRGSRSAPRARGASGTRARSPRAAPGLPRRPSRGRPSTRGARETSPLARPLPAARSIVRVPCSAPGARSRRTGKGGRGGPSRRSSRSPAAPSGPGGGRSRRRGRRGRERGALAAARPRSVRSAARQRPLRLLSYSAKRTRKSRGNCASAARYRFT